MTDLKSIADELVAGCREGREAENLDALYAADAVSVEAAAMPGTDSREAKGLDAIRGKHAWWSENMEMTGGEVLGPYPHGDDRFAVVFRAQGRERATGNSFEMEEVGVYHVANGKIVREEFFYTTG
ncbi:SnoaL-like domain protein [Roseivivax jejudonensis]|uniref:SnoaL-like domain protein n=1 Tax=Roseivivax jejudonensis TaxID=1529041 RepID=A0A1X6Z5X0_9RHOB|nr:nuclear transport factor 2 family protein [Roseivivax jejudonensis]SLN41283.1 SnoaL-like domain protein [Roseivivax jejudonensis]